MSEKIAFKSPVKLGKYMIKSELGQGAMGVVYEGFDPLIERSVALKTIRKDLLDSKEADNLLVRFKREAQAAGRLNHPNIVAVYDYDEDGNTAFIAMEFVQGRSLKSFFDNNERFDLSDIIRIMSQVLGALSYAHENGVVHRDIKPANIILTDNAQVKITDFGIAHIESSNLTQTGMIMGTPNFMSPEQFMGHRIDGRSDLFSAGVMLYQFVTGENPFDGTNMATIMQKVLNTEPLNPADLNLHISQDLNAVIKKAISKKPEDRFQNAQVFFTALNQSLQSDSPAPVSSPPVEEPAKTGTDTDSTVILSSQDSTKADGQVETFNSQASLSPAVESGKDPVSSDSGGRFKRLFAGVFIVLIAVAAGIFFLFPKSIKTDSNIKPVHTESMKPEFPGDTAKIPQEKPEPVKLPDYVSKPSDAQIADDKEVPQKNPEPVKLPDAPEHKIKEITFDSVIAELKKLGKDNEPDFFQVWTNKQNLKIGEQVSYHFKSEKDCYLNLLNLTVEEGLIQVFPNSFTPDAFVKAGKEYSIPGPEINLVLNVTGPPGIENIIAFVSEEPLNLLNSEFEKQAFYELDRDKQELLNKISENIRQAESNSIVQKQIHYTIQ